MAEPNLPSRRDALRGGLFASAAAILTGTGAKVVEAAQASTTVAAAVPVAEATKLNELLSQAAEGLTGAADPVLDFSIMPEPVSEKLNSVLSALDRMTSTMERMIESKPTRPSGLAQDPLLRVDVSKLLRIVIDENGHVQKVVDPQGRIVSNVASVSYRAECHDPLSASVSRDPNAPVLVTADFEMSSIGRPMAFGNKPFTDAEHTFLQVLLLHGQMCIKLHDSGVETVPTAKVFNVSAAANNFTKYTAQAQMRLVLEQRGPSDEEIANLRKLWVDAFGDPNDPAVKAEINACVDLLLGPAPGQFVQTSHPGDIFKTGRQLGKSTSLGYPRRYATYDELNRQTAALQLAMSGRISRTASLKYAGLDWMSEQQRWLAEEMQQQVYMQQTLDRGCATKPIA